MGIILPGALAPVATALGVKTAPASVMVARIWNRLFLTAFPNLDDALKWPCMKKFICGEYSGQETEERFIARINPILAEIKKWEIQVIANLTSKLQKGQETKPEEDSVSLTASLYAG